MNGRSVWRDELSVARQRRFVLPVRHGDQTVEGLITAVTTAQPPGHGAPDGEPSQVQPPVTEPPVAVNRALRIAAYALPAHPLT